MKSYTLLAIVLGLQLIDRMSWSQEDVSVTFERIPFPAGYNYCEAPLPDVQGYAPIPGAELRVVQFLFRHGDRAPTSPLANEDGVWDRCGRDSERVLHDNDTEDDQNETGQTSIEHMERRIDIPESHSGFQRFWKGNCNAGQLTDVGASQARALGQSLRSLYLNSRNDKEWKSDIWGSAGVPNEDNVFVRSTDVWRTMQTAQNVYRGLFPGSNSSYPKAPRIHIRPKWVDSLSMDIDTKPGLKAIYKASRKESPEFIAFRLEASRLMERLHQVLGHEFADVPLERLYDQLQCRLCHSQPIPCGSNGCLSSKDIAQVLSLGEWWSRLEFTAEGGPRRREERRLRIGGLLRDLVSSAFRSHSETSGNTLKKQMYLYAAHDTTLMPILATLDQTTNVPWPPYASHLTFETWQFTNGNHSRVLRIGYNGRWMNLSETHQHVSEVAIKAKLSVWTD